jgi:hypothetical protein
MPLDAPVTTTTSDDMRATYPRRRPLCRLRRRRRYDEAGAGTGWAVSR